MTTALYEVTELCKGRGETDNIIAVLLRARESGYVRLKGTGIDKLKEIFHITPRNAGALAATLLETAQVTQRRR